MNPTTDTCQNCYKLLQNVLMEAFQTETFFFTPPYKDLGKGKQPKRVSIDRTTETEKFVTRLEVEIGGFTKKIYTKKIVVYNKK